MPDRTAIPEKTTEPVDENPARLWSMFDGFTAEVETLDFLLTLTRLVKPTHALETGTWLGFSACAIGRGLVANGFGRLTSLEINREVHQAALENIARYGLGHVVDARLTSSMDFEPAHDFEMALFDSELPLRLAEFRRFKPWLKPGAVILFHDTAAHHQVVLAGVRALVADGEIIGVDLPTPRGIFIGRTMGGPGRL